MTASAEMTSRKQNLVAELTQEGADALQRGKKNHLTTVVLMVIALGCSVTALVLGLVLGMAKTAGIFAVLPPLIAYVATNLKLEGKASWHYRRSDAITALRSRLLYEMPEPPTADNIAAISRERRTVENEMQKEWDDKLRLDFGMIGKKIEP